MLIQVAITDDHPVFRRMLRALLELVPGLQVVAEAGSGQELIALARVVAIDVVCMDIRMPVMDGIEATQQLLRECPQIKVIGLSSYNDQHFIDAMMRAGARGYLTKDDAADHLPEAIRTVACSHRYFGPGIAYDSEAAATIGKR